SAGFLLPTREARFLFSRFTRRAHSTHAPLYFPCSLQGTPPGVLAPSAAGADLRPGVAQPDRPVEHRFARLRIRVAHEIALPLELHGLGCIAAGEPRLEPRVGQHLEGIRIDVGGEA